MSRATSSMLTGCATIEGDIPTPSPFVQTFKTITYGCLLDLAAMPAACIGTSNVNRLLVHNPTELYGGQESSHYATIWKMTGTNYLHISHYSCIAVSRNMAHFRAYDPGDHSTAYAAFEFDGFDVAPTDLLFIRFQPNQVTTTGGVKLPPYWYGAGPKPSGSRSAAVTNVSNGNLTVSAAMAVDARLEERKRSVAVLGGSNGTIGDQSFSVGVAEASGRHSIAFGPNARAVHHRAFVWNGQETEYASNGVSTFSLNPAGGAAGVFIGSKSLPQVIDEQIPSLRGTYDLSDEQTIQTAISDIVTAFGGTVILPRRHVGRTQSWPARILRALKHLCHP